MPVIFELEGLEGLEEVRHEEVRHEARIDPRSGVEGGHRFLRICGRTGTGLESVNWRRGREYERWVAHIWAEWTGVNTGYMSPRAGAGQEYVSAAFCPLSTLRVSGRNTCCLIQRPSFALSNDSQRPPTSCIPIAAAKVRCSVHIVSHSACVHSPLSHLAWTFGAVVRAFGESRRRRYPSPLGAHAVIRPSSTHCLISAPIASVADAVTQITSSS